MGLNRRQTIALTAALALAPRAALAEAPPPPLFADFGPTAPARAAYDQAIDRGADFLIAPVVAAKDGALVVAAEIELSAFTDVARRPEFADRRKDRTVDGAAMSGWFSDDFTLAELRTLMIGPPPRSQREAPSTLMALQDLVDIARAGSVRQARVVGVSPRLVRPAFFAGSELALESRLADFIRVAGYDSAAAAMIVQSGEPASLKTLAALSSVRRIQLVDAEGGPADQAAMRYAAMASADGLAAVKAWAGAVAPVASMLVTPGPKGVLLPSGLAAAAHAAGLAIYPRAAPNAPRALLAALFAAGADGLMCPDVGQGAHARGEAMDRLKPRSSEG
jgi:glycerophosphoryl diester phosphodiesterase